MIPVQSMQHHPLSEQLVQVLVDRTQNQNPLFFRVLVGYYFSVVASHMRCQINTPDRGLIPVNMFAINLMPSGAGKGHSTGIMEDEVVHLFRQTFMEVTFPTLANDNIPTLAVKRATRKSTDPDDELKLVTKEFNQTGEMVFGFDSGTAPAVKQLRHKCLMANAGCVNLQMDEIGSNLMANTEVLNAFLELFDKGMIKSKLTKNTSENTRVEEIKGATPTNMMLYGTPVKLLNGSKTEEELMSFLDTGYARRCFFGYSLVSHRRQDLTPQEVFDLMTNPSTNLFLEQLADKLERLANIINVRKKLVMAKDTSLLLIEYKLDCEKRAEALADHEESRKAEISHRYFKALKLAGAYAFVDESPELTQDHLLAAIKLAEESGEAFDMLLTRDRPYVKLAKYIASVNREVTQADLVEDLPFYRGSASARSDLMQLAISWGYRNNIIVKKSFQDGIEFLRGESLKETDLKEIILAFSDDMTTGYRNELAPFDKLHQMTQVNGLHWVTHHLKDGYRNEESAAPGFNLIVIDVDGTCNLSTAKLVLKDYKALYYTTKRHTEKENRFRIILPTSHVLKLDAKDYKEFMNNIYQWLPFPVDDQTDQRARKWLTHPGHYEYTEGQTIDVLPLIPKTDKNEQRKAQLDSQQAMDALERWVINNTGDGNRNNMLLRFAMILVDAGFDFESTRLKVMALNDKLPDKLDEAEILGSIMITVGKALAKRAAP